MAYGDWSSDMCSSDRPAAAKTTFVSTVASPWLPSLLMTSMPAIVIREPSSEVVPRRTVPAFVMLRSEERRVGKECRLGVAPEEESETTDRQVGAWVMS